MVDSVNKSLMKTRNKFFSEYSFWPIFLIGFSLRIVNVSAPILGVHSWRQADTGAIARNYLENGLVFWLPQVDWSGASSGFVECEFPLYQYLVALMYKLFGVNELIARGFSVLCSCLTVFMIFSLGTRLFGRRAGWWGALFYAIMPISVFYGRTIQPESLMILFATFSLEKWLTFLQFHKLRDLIFCWIAFTFAVLIKVLPLFWVGIPILVTAYQNKILFKRYIFYFACFSLIIVSSWYLYSYNLGQSTGLTFGLWGADTDRYDWSILADFRYYSDLLIRIVFRNLMLLGLPLFCYGCRYIKSNNICIIGALSVFFVGLLNPISFGIHEYYQLPLMIFFTPIIGLGFCKFKDNLSSYRVFLPSLLFALIFISSILMLQIDYWSQENIKIQKVWDSAQFLQENTSKSDKAISVTGGDPTMLYLANRKGWLASPSMISSDAILTWKRQGAKYIAGHWSIIENYNQFNDSKLKSLLYENLCSSIKKNENRDYYLNSCSDDNGSYLIPID